MGNATEPANDELELLSQGLKVLELCQKIAVSIMTGNKVPLEDLRFLMENDLDGYWISMVMRRHKENPEEVNSVLEDEDKNGGFAEGVIFAIDIHGIYFIVMGRIQDDKDIHSTTS